MHIQTLRIFLLPFIVVAAGCSIQRERLGYVDGLSPIPKAETIEESTNNQNHVFEQLLRRAGAEFCITDPKKNSMKCTAPNDDDPHWSKIVEAGFGFVDEQCEQYIDALFWYNRFRNTTSKQLSITGAATASIMGIVDSSAKAIAVTAAAFGLSSASFDNLTANVLFELEPSGVKSLVDRSKATYRSALGQRVDATTKNVARNRPEAMSLIRGYLSLCLPASIETQVNNAVAATDFEVEDPTLPGSIVPKLQRVNRGENQARKLIRAETELRLLRPKGPINPTEKAPSGIKNALTRIEVGLSRSEGQKIQEALCVVGDGDFGKIGSNTREAIKLYQVAKGIPEAELDGRLNKPGFRDSLINAGRCLGTNANYLNAYERFLYWNSTEIRKLQGRINKELTNLDLTPSLPSSPFSGIFDRETRAAIKQLKAIKEITTRVEELTPDLDKDVES